MNRMSSVRMNAVHDKASKAALIRQNAWLHYRDHPIHRDQRELRAPAGPVGSGEDGQHHDADEHEPQDRAPPLGPVFEVEEDGLNGVVGNTVNGCRR